MKITEDGWFRADVPVRFRDIDAMGHAHHTLPLVYLEEARAAFWRELKGSASVDAIDYVMAEITLRFHARIRFPSDVTVGLAVRRVGTKSFTTDFEVRSASGELLSSGTTVQVAYDYTAERTKAIDPADRAILERWLTAGNSSFGSAG
ncbi:MAG: acyl-CoA thioesterase [Gemmatimonadetes bacterium]|nr:acyl-CoA thioesterase [Gemmatimonadota bacterium]